MQSSGKLILWIRTKDEGWSVTWRIVLSSSSSSSSSFSSCCCWPSSCCLRVPPSTTAIALHGIVLSPSRSAAGFMSPLSPFLHFRYQILRSWFHTQASDRASQHTKLSIWFFARTPFSNETPVQISQTLLLTLRSHGTFSWNSGPNFADPAPVDAYARMPLSRGTPVQIQREGFSKGVFFFLFLLWGVVWGWGREPRLSTIC